MTTRANQLVTVSRADVQAAARRNAYWRGRWGYVGIALRMLAAVPGARRVLEVGPGDMRLVRGSDTLDVRAWGGLALTHHWDARRTPWPIADGAYDAVLALQVLEHLGEARFRAVGEMARIAPWAVLSIPYRWPGDGQHAGLTLDWLRTCCRGGRLVRHAVSGPRVTVRTRGRPTPLRHLVALWRFDG